MNLANEYTSKPHQTSSALKLSISDILKPSSTEFQSNASEEKFTSLIWKSVNNDNFDSVQHCSEQCKSDCSESDYTEPLHVNLENESIRENFIECKNNGESKDDQEEKETVTNPKHDPNHLNTTKWLIGGSLGMRTSILLFRSSALADTSQDSIISKPAFRLHITYKVLQAETKLLSKLLDCHGVTELTNASNDFNLLWTGCHPKPGVLRALAPHQRVNHFPRSYELTRKDRLYKNIENMQHAKGFKHFDFVPQTFVMPGEYKDLCTTHHRIKGPWIVKPVASSRGRGIYIVESPSQVPLEEPVVVAKYISRPLLVEGHKCDLRLYVAVTSFDPLLVYIYEEGMVRFATVKYDTSHRQLWNPCMHLCNYSINKYHSDYVKAEDPSAENIGHKWTLSAFLRHLKSQDKDTALLMTQIEDVIVKAVLASGNSIISACKMFVPHTNSCFELYGFDILIDENLKPWLLEVNLSPSLGCDSPLDVRLKSAMLSDLLTLVGIPAVDPMLRPCTNSVSSVSSNKIGAGNVHRTKLANCKRVQSADALSNTLPKKSSNSSNASNDRLGTSLMTLSAEETRLIANVRAQFERRGGFVRIFPAVDSWLKYSQYLDPISGIPIAGLCSSTSYSLATPHNVNLLLYSTLFSDAPLVASLRPNEPRLGYHRSSSLDRHRSLLYDSSVSLNQRQNRYERKLSEGYRSSLGPKKIMPLESRSVELKQQVCDMMKNGRRMSQSEARRTFSQYLNCILHRISSSPDQEDHVEVVLKFLQKASNYLRTPFTVKAPSHKLTRKDRAAIVAKQLNDFLYLYNRETELYSTVLERPNQLPRKIFSDFLENAREIDLQDVLKLQSSNPAIIPTLRGSNNVATFQSLLKCLPVGIPLAQSTAKKGLKLAPLS